MHQESHADESVARQGVPMELQLRAADPKSVIHSVCPYGRGTRSVGEWILRADGCTRERFKILANRASSERLGDQKATEKDESDPA